MISGGFHKKKGKTDRGKGHLRSLLRKEPPYWGGRIEWRKRGSISFKEKHLILEKEKRKEAQGKGKGIPS